MGLHFIATFQPSSLCSLVYSMMSIAEPAFVRWRKQSGLCRPRARTRPFDTMGGCIACICCYSEGARVGKVLDAFPQQRASEAKDGGLQKLVGRVVLAGQQPFYAPVTGKPCVYYKTVVQEERIRRRRTKNGWHTYRVWVTIAIAEQFSNFYLQDGVTRIFVPGNRGTCRIQSLKGGGISGLWTGPPPLGVHSMIMASFHARGQSFWGWGMRAGTTGRYSYTEESFDVNEIVTALGVPVAAQDPYTQEPVKVIQPFSQDTLTVEWMKEHKWTLLQRKSWETLLKQGGAVLLSDNPKQTSGVPIDVIHNLPQYMVAVAVSADQFTPDMYAGSKQLATAVAATDDDAGTE
jgi:hypothetical protein